MTTSWLLEVAVQDQADMIAKLAELQGRGFKILRGAEEDHIEGIGLDREEVDGLRARHEAAPPPIIDERERRYLSRQRELSLTVEPGSGLTAGALDPHDELAIRADEIQAAFWMRKGIRISQAEAVRKAFVSDPTLFQRLQKAAREKAMARVRQLHPNAQWVRRK